MALVELQCRHQAEFEVHLQIGPGIVWEGRKVRHCIPEGLAAPRSPVIDKIERVYVFPCILTVYSQVRQAQGALEMPPVSLDLGLAGSVAIDPDPAMMIDDLMMPPSPVQAAIAGKAVGHEYGSRPDDVFDQRDERRCAPVRHNRRQQVLTRTQGNQTGLVGPVARGQDAAQQGLVDKDLLEDRRCGCDRSTWRGGSGSGRTA